MKSSAITKAAIAAVKRGDFKFTDEGLILTSPGIRPCGRYDTTINGVKQEPIYNQMPSEGLLFTLQVLCGDASVPTGFYLAPFSTNNPVVSSWTGANFTSNSQEWTAGTGGSGEGYNESTRQAWTPTAVGQVYTNAAAEASFTIVCSTSLAISGIGLIANDSVKGGTTGKLISAARYPSARTTYPSDNFGVVYTLELQDS